MLGSIDSNTGSPDLGWDTDQFPMEIKNTTLIMKVFEPLTIINNLLVRLSLSRGAWPQGVLILIVKFVENPLIFKICS